MPPIDLDRLKFYAKKGIGWYWLKYKDYVHTCPRGKYIYIPSKTGSKILAVAHLDTVIDPTKTFSQNTIQRTTTRKDGSIIKYSEVKCTTLDDRLGVYIILDYLDKHLGEGWANILLTEGEETGKSTAKGFDMKLLLPDGEDVDGISDKEIAEKLNLNWMVEFDRMGSAMSGTVDAVTYGYYSSEWSKTLEDSGFVGIGKGSVTDISYLEGLGVKALNVAVGYHNNHSTKASFHPVETERTLGIFCAFYDKHKDTKFPHVEKKKKVWTPTQHTVTRPASRFQIGQIVTHFGKAGRIIGFFPDALSAHGFGLNCRRAALIDTNGNLISSPIYGAYLHSGTTILDVCSICMSMLKPSFETGTMRMCRECAANYVKAEFTCNRCLQDVKIDEIVDDIYCICEECVNAELDYTVGDYVYFFDSGGYPYLVINIEDGENGRKVATLQGTHKGRMPHKVPAYLLEADDWAQLALTNGGVHV